MKSSGFFALLAIRLLFISPAVSQDFLAYFNGNEDSLIAQATAFIQLPDPVFEPVDFPKMEETILKKQEPQKPQKLHECYFTARDQHRLFAWKFFSKRSPHTILLLHGVKSRARDYLQTADLLRKATGAEVYALDLRGHGRSEGRSGDVDYLNQYADDVTDVIAAIRRQKPSGKIILAGHSMGGGIALRYAMGQSQENIDGFLLFAPLIGHDSPAFPTASAAENPENNRVGAFMQIHIMRIIGLKMLNAIDRHEYDHLPVLFFNLPENMPIRQYTYRANMSMAPEHYTEGLNAVKVPLLVVIGDQDEAFVASALEKAVLENSKGEVQVIAGATHNGVTCHPQAFQRIAQWFSKLK